MSNINKLIIILLVLGIALTTAATIFVLKQDENNEYERAQLRAETADINYILPYNNKYMGNHSNLAALFGHLPLSDTRTTFQLYPNDLAAKVYYEDSMLQAGKTNLQYSSYSLEGLEHAIDDFYATEVKRSLIYNSTAAFALIENLDALIYEFTDTSFIVTRSDIEGIYMDFANILDDEVWTRRVQAPLEDQGYVKDIANRVLKDQ